MNKIKIISFIISLSLLLSGFALSKEPGNIKLKPYCHEHFGIRINIPTDWKLTFSGDQGGLVATFSKNITPAQTYFNIIVEQMVEPVPLNVCVDRNLKKITQNIKGCLVLSRKSLVLSNLPAQEVIFSYSLILNDKQEKFKSVQYFLLKGNLAYYFTYKIKEKNFNSDISLARKIMRSLQLEK